MNRPRFLADHDLNEHIVAGVMRLHPEIEFVRVRDVASQTHPISTYSPTLPADRSALFPTTSTP